MIPADGACERAASAIDILHLDDAIVAVAKPPGLLVHRTALDRHETRFAMQLVRDRLGRRVWPVHRLDKGTSGVLLFALSPEVARVLGEAFETRAVEKRYVAVVRGWPDAHGVIDHPLSRRFDDAERRADDGVLQPALTEYRRIATLELPHAVDRYATARYALAALVPHTGRRHQLRRHLKHIAHPIIGDATFGKGRHNRFFAETVGTQRLWLHAGLLAFAHPATGERVRIAAPLGEEWRTVLDAFGVTEADLDRHC